MFKINVDKHERFEDYCQYRIEDEDGNTIAILFGPMAAVCSEIILQKLESGETLPEPKDVFARNDKQKGIIR